MKRRSIRERVRDFIRGPDKFKEAFGEQGNMRDIAEDLRGYSAILSRRNQFSDRDIPSLLSDPIVGSAISLALETAFQINHDQTLFKLLSPFDKVKEELDIFHERIDVDSFILILAYNLLAYGNMPIRLVWSEKNEFMRLELEPDYVSVMPVILSNQVLGYIKDGKYHEPFEYVYSQLMYYRDMGGTRAKLANLGSTSDGVQTLNEFMLAPSYISAAIKPWRSIKIIEDALILQRMDQSNFMRLIMVTVGNDVTSKNAIKLLNYYRQILKKARRISFDTDGMSSASFGNEFDLVLPKSTKNDLDVKEVGGQCLRGNTEIKLLDGRDVSILEMYQEREQYIGKGVYTCATDGSVGVSPITNITSLRKNTSFVRVTLDNGKYFDVTPDHPCQMRSGDFMMAGELKPGDSLMPLYAETDLTNHVGYEKLLDNKSGKKIFTHEIVGDYLAGRPLSGTGIHRHHIDEDKSNNDFSNIQLLSSSRHTQKHKEHIVNMRKAAALRMIERGTTKKQRDAWALNRIKANEVKKIKYATEGATEKMKLHLAEVRGDANAARIKKWASFGITEKHKEILRVLAFKGREVLRLRIINEGFTEAQKQSARENIRFAIQASQVSREKNRKSIKTDLVCCVCHRGFSRVVKPSKMLKGIDAYKLEPRFCSVLCRSHYNGHGAFKESILAGVNHKVVSVVALDVVEDSYDLTVESKNHCFALTAGVFVHNTEVKAIKDLDQQYKKLFSALRVNPSMIGYSEEPGSSLGGESPATVFEKRFARAVKTVVASVSRTLKQIDYYYLRSLGYDVCKQDWSYQFVSVSTLEEEEKRKAVSVGVESLKALVEALDITTVPYNKEYLVREYATQLFASSPLDVNELFKIQEVAGAPVEGEIVSSSVRRKIVKGSKSLLSTETQSALKIFVDIGMLDSSEVGLGSESIAKVQVNSTISYEDFCTAPDQAEAGEKIVLLRSSLDVRPTEKQIAGATLTAEELVIPINNIKFVKGEMQAKKLNQGTYAPLEDVYLMNGTYIVSGDDLVNYLFMADSGVKEVFARKVWKLV